MTFANLVRTIFLLVLFASAPAMGQEDRANLLPGEDGQLRLPAVAQEVSDPKAQSPQLPNKQTPEETEEGTPSVIQENADTKRQDAENDDPSISVLTDPSTELSEPELPQIDHSKNLEELKKLRRIEAMIEKVIPQVAPCVVSIGETASGVIVKPSGIIITASHVTRKAGRILNIRLHNGQILQGITLGSNAANDTSAIQLLGNGPWPYLKTVSPDYTAQAGQWCIAFGYPLSWPRDKPASARIGRVTGQYRGKMVTDCPIMGGDSGGALVDLNGNLLGINSSVRLDVTQNLHVPIKRYRDDWTYMMTRQDVDVVTARVPTSESDSGTETPAPAGKPYLGIYAESIDNGVRIRDVRRNSPAEKASLLPEDVIWQIDETLIGSFAELLKYLATRNGGDVITVRVNRFGVKLDILVTLDQR